jgi:hypothetical protein
MGGDKCQVCGSEAGTLIYVNGQLTWECGGCGLQEDVKDGKHG